MNRCRTCDEMKDDKHFSLSGSTRGGLRHMCRACCAAYHRGRRDHQRSQDVLRKYKLTPERYKELLASQGDGCAICHVSAVDAQMVVDHDHSCCPGPKSCGECVRGLLCQRCNRWLGIAEDKIEILTDAISYLSAKKR